MKQGADPAGSRQVCRVVLALLAAALLSAVHAESFEARQLPEGNLILAYATECDERALQAGLQGVNVIIWFAANLVADDSRRPKVNFSKSNSNFSCIANTWRTLKEKGLSTAHLMTVGGWDAPHPDEAFNGSEYYGAWKRWNSDLAESYQWPGFDGIDWDLEGNDKPTSSDNAFSLKCLDTMGAFSTLAKQDGYLVTLVPPESYFDVSTAEFGRSLRYPPHDDWQAEFLYQGRNAYAYLLAKYGTGTFDLVSVQLYETFSHAAFNIYHEWSDPGSYLAEWVQSFRDARGFQGLQTVRFSSDPLLSLPDQDVPLDVARKLIIGLSFGAFDNRSVWIRPEDVGRAWQKMRGTEGGLVPRGVMYWNIYLDSKLGYEMTKGLNNFLHARAEGSEGPAGSPAPQAETRVV